MPRKNISSSTIKKLLLLITFLICLFAVVYVSFFYYIKQQEVLVHEKAVDHLNNEVRSLVELKSDPLLSAITDLTYWDKFVDYFDSLDHDWYEEDVESVIESFDIDYVAVFDLETRLLRSRKTDEFKTENFIPPYAFKLVHQKKLLTFYMKTQEGIIEVIGATVHPSNDPEKLNTEPSGYFFISRLLNKEYTNNLEQISGTTVSISNVTILTNHSKNEQETNAYIPLLDWNKQQIAQLNFTRPYIINFNITRKILYITISAFVFNLLVILIFFKKWIYNPLFLVTKILKSKDSDSIVSLKKMPGEFGQIGNLFNINHKQNEALKKAKNKAEEADRLKMAFLTNLSHEIRTPMNAVVGFSDLLKDNNLSKKDRKEYLEIIEKSGNNLVLIIDDLIEMSKIDSAQISPNYTAVNLDNSLNEIYESVRITIRKKDQINFQLELPEISIERNVMVDITKLKQIITNLLTNALKFTDHGFIKFGYTVNAPKNKIVFYVEDSGRGIHKNDQISIFTRFRKLDQNSSGFNTGLGLGLAISKAYVEMMGGELSLKSEFKNGSTFTFTLPLQFDILNGIHDEKCPVNLVSYNKELVGNILVAEDDNINFLLVNKLIKSKNHEVTRAINGIEAVELSNMPEIDLILMDIKMPEMDGFEAMRKIKLIRPDLPVIAHTAYVSEEIKTEIKDAGFCGYIKKPLQKELLFNMVNEVLLNISKGQPNKLI